MDLRRLARALRRERMIDDYVAVERRRRAATRAEIPGPLIRMEHTRILRGHVFRDLRRGRGGASFVVDTDGDLNTLVRQALSRASRSIGPAWTLPPPEAPARVELADSAIRSNPESAAAATARELLAAVGTKGVAARAAGGPLVLTAAHIECQIDDVRVRTSNGFANEYQATGIEVDAFLALRDGDNASAERIAVAGRHRSSLRLGAKLVAAAGRLRDRARAKAPTAGRYDLLLTGDAITATSPGASASRYGWFFPVVAQSSATLERQGLTRYRVGQSIYRTPVRGDRISITSDGTIPFALESRPFGDLGEPIRTWPVIRDGKASGLALDLREAALRKERANGGLSNLVIASGPSSLASLAAPAKQRPLLRVTDLAWLHSDPRTGWCSAELGLGYRADSSGETPTRGGALRADVFELLARARFSTERMSEGWYHGPRAIRIDDVEIR